MDGFRLHEAGNPARRGKPAGVAAAGIFSYVGNSAPSDPSLYKFEGNVSRTVVDITFPATVAAGAQVWICAMWLNAKMQSGAGCQAVGATLAGGSTIAV